ncbi:hypothetical protein N431DRAFT_449561 [Stipitochalara longipes BDJ]|nr:hypothetical protein N431DRAFT_449561 [Stipitochalara longipes BDJ]
MCSDLCTFSSFNPQDAVLIATIEDCLVGKPTALFIAQHQRGPAGPTAQTSSARSAPSAPRPISEHHDWQLRNNCDSQDLPFPPSSQFEYEFSLLLYSRGITDPENEPHLDSYHDLVTFDATVSQLYIPGSNLSSHPLSCSNPEPLHQEIPLHAQQSSSSSTGSPDYSISSLPSTGVRSPSSRAPTELSSPDASVAPPSLPTSGSVQVPQAPRQALFRCTQCPSHAPFRLQSQLTRHTKTHTKPYSCRVQQTCGKRFAEKRDRLRHEAGHSLQVRGIAQYFCPHGCERSTTGAEGGFGVREDNAKRHIRTRHDGSTAAPIRIIT